MTSIRPSRLIHVAAASVGYDMSFAKLYPTVESLPVTPIRIRCTRTTRRLAWICLLSPFVLTAVTALFWQWLLQEPIPQEQLLTAFLSTMGLIGAMGACFWLVTYDIEISAEGIRTIGRLRTGRVFRWDDFRNQCVREGRLLCSYELIDREMENAVREQLGAAANWSVPVASLSFGDCRPEAEAWIGGLIRSVWVRPDPPSVPEFVYIRPGRPVMASSRGVTVIAQPLVEHNKIETDIVKALEDAQRGDLVPWEQLEEKWSRYTTSWNEVEQVEVWQLAHDRHDFERMTIQLPERDVSSSRKLTLRHGKKGNSRSISYAATQDMLALIRRHVGAERLTISPLNGPPRSLEEWERCYEKVVGSKRKTKRFMKRVFIGHCLLNCLVIVLWPDGLLLLVAALPYAMVSGPMWMIAGKETARLEAQYAAWKRDLME